MTQEEMQAALARLKLLTDEVDAEAVAGTECETCAEGDERFYTDAELEEILTLHEGDVREAAYDVLLRKAKITDIRLAGGTQLPDQRVYWLSRARAVRPNRGRAGARADGT